MLATSPVQHPSQEEESQPLGSTAVPFHIRSRGMVHLLFISEVFKAKRDLGHGSLNWISVHWPRGFQRTLSEALGSCCIRSVLGVQWAGPRLTPNQDRL